ncbi:hypothetical protein N8Z82_01645 [Pelagibacteraceae bacterium]|nr:hypothetical protein [Pelagibacteraceae bacterium]
MKIRIKNNSISINLPSPKLKDSEYYTEKPFVIFSNDNFIDKAVYSNFILKMKSLFEDKDWDEGDRGKKRFKFDANRNKDYDELDKVISDFIGIFRTKEFRHWFKQTHEPFYDMGLLGSVFPKYKLVELILRAINKISRRVFKSKAFNIYTTQVEFSKIGLGASLVPHTDSFGKRMALVFYTPFIETTKDMESQWGTTFWQAKSGQKPLRSWTSSHKLEEKELEDFLNKNEVVKSVYYKPNRVNGFIKSDLSWHSVEKNVFAENRVAIVININDIASTEQDIPLIEDIQAKLLGKNSEVSS